MPRNSLILLVIITFSVIAAADVRYDIIATIDGDTYSLTGSASIVISADNLPRDDILFFNLSVGSGAELSISSVMVDGVRVSPKIEAGLAGITLPGGAGNGSVTIDLAFALSELPDDAGVTLLDDNLRDGVWSTWYPRYLTPTPEAAAYDVQLRVVGPGGVAHPGRSHTVTRERNGATYAFSLPAVWSAAIVYSPIFVEQRVLVGGCDLGIMVREGSEGWSNLLLTFLSEAYDYYTENAGSLGVARLDVVFGGEDYEPGVFTPRLGVIKDETGRMLDEYGGVFTKNYLRWQASSELAEVLIGADVTQEPGAIPWLREGLSLNLTERYARSALLGGPVFDNIRQFYLNAAAAGKSTSLAQTTAEALEAGVDPYQTLARSKGMWIVGMLVERFARDGLGRFIGELAARSGAPLSNEDIRAVAEEVAGAGLGEFFDQWVFGDAYVDYGVGDVRNGDGGARVEVKNSGKVAAPVEVVAVFDDGESQTSTVTLAQDSKWIDFPAGKRLLRVRIDPDVLLPDINRSNNLRSLGGGERIESLYAIDKFFDIGDIRLVGAPEPFNDAYRQNEFELTITNERDETARLGVHLIASFAGGRNRGLTRLFIELAPGETRTIRDRLLFPTRGDGLIEVTARYFPVASREQYEQIDRSTKPQLVNYYIYDIGS